MTGPDAWDRLAARDVLADAVEQLLAGLDPDWDRLLDALERCVRPFGWDDMLDLLRTTYPEWMIPQYRDADYGNGPQVVSLLRLVAYLRTGEQP